MGLYVKEGVSVLNIIGMIATVPALLQLVVFTEAMFIYLLQNENYYNLSTQDASIVAGDIMFWTQLIGLCNYLLP